MPTADDRACDAGGVRAGVSAAALVVGRDAEKVADAARVAGVSVEPYLQKERLGTGNAVLAAREAIEKGFDDILIAYAMCRF